jgi:hypothetical protein
MTLNKLLYHGTAASKLERIKAQGILPRSISRATDNWKHTVTSNRSAVYLTSAYPWHFAACASKNDNRGLILEIKGDLLNPRYLCPDENFMEQASRNVGPSEEQPYLAEVGWSMKKRVRHYRNICRYNPHLTEMSLEGMGTCAYYGKIPWPAVTRYVVIEWSKLHPGMYIMAIDSTVAAINFKILRQRHEAYVRWFFGDPVEPSELIGLGGLERLPVGAQVNPELRAMLEKQEDLMKAAMAQREGLHVVCVRSLL